MSTQDDTRPPPLPEEARFALSAFRAERPSAQARYRLHTALQAAGSDRPLPRRAHPERAARRWSTPALRVALGAALSGALLVGVMVQPRGGDLQTRQRQILPSRHLAMQLPEEGSGWIELPWSIDDHPEGMALVHVETPVEMNFHEHHSEHLPSLQLVSCEGERCLHQFEAPSGPSAQPLRVRIHRPGRYELRVSHASEARHIDEHFVVVAEL
ncbi:MAG TPA: hypothetical protein VLQ93_25250 [Myxococcaceae bacterium]|nr:hypothetical protein [Myxococcaceae bacterium]